MSDPFVITVANQPDSGPESSLPGPVSWAFGASAVTIVLDWLYQAVTPLAAFALPLFAHHYIHRARPNLTVKLPAAFPSPTASNFPEVNASIFGQRHPHGPGTYTLIASSPGFLSATCGAVDMVDVVALGPAFGRPGPAEVADLNTDGLIDILDMILLAANYGQAATDNPWVCQ
jgi:hypothetical protein